jgi:hypothetical protein
MPTKLRIFPDIPKSPTPTRSKFGQEHRERSAATQKCAHFAADFPPQHFALSNVFGPKHFALSNVFTLKHFALSNIFRIFAALNH